MARREISGLKYPGGDKIRAMRRSDKPNRIAGRLQAELKQRGLYDGDHDKIWSRKLKRAVKEFQRKKGLTVDGIPGPQVWKALGWPVPEGSGDPNYNWIWRRPGVVWPTDKTFMRKMNAIGKEAYQKHGKRLVVVSGLRTAYQAWDLRMRYLRGTGNLAALCCGNTGIHSWAACGKAPRSNHASGHAMDCGFENKNGGGYQSFLYLPWARALARKEVICFPVPGERLPMARGARNQLA